MKEYPNETIVFGLLVISFIFEIILSATWNKMYFTMGIPILVLKLPVDRHYSNTPPLYRIQKEIEGNWNVSVALKEFDTGVFGFSESTWTGISHYTPIMHGLLLFDNENHQVVVKGLPNIFFTVFSTVWLGSVIFFAPLLIKIGFTSFYALVVGILYWIQYSRYKKVASFATRAWLPLGLTQRAATVLKVKGKR